MRHLKAGKKLGRSPEHRRALYRNLALALIRHERIITTLPKAKAVRPFVERLITLARKGTLHHRRLAASRLGPMAEAEVNPSDDDAKADRRTVLQKLFDELGPRFKERQGGYTRVIKRHQRRLGDGGFTAFLELLQEGETRSRAKAPSAPRVEEEPPRDETPPGETPAEQETEKAESQETSETNEGAGGQTPDTAPEDKDKA